MDNETPESPYHPLVDLMLSRMKNHPEEFYGPKAGRWATAMGGVRSYATTEEVQVVEAAFNRLMLDHHHAEALQELLDPTEDRKRREEEARKAQLKQVYLQQQLNQLNRLGGSGTTSSGAVPGGVYLGTPTSTWVDTTSTYASNHSLATNEINLGGEKLDSTMLAKMKKLLGL